jgi:hypothetical protein
MTSSATYNGRIPTDPHTILILILGIVHTATQLTNQQAQALIATGGIAELVLLLFRILHARR